jgi:hypothetical protein
MTAVTPDPLSETLDTIDALITRAVALSQDVARFKQELSDLTEERRVREAVLLLGVEGKNESERQARLRLELAADADYRRMAEEEKAARRKLAEVEAKLWAARMKVHTCLALFKLAAGQAEEGEGEEEAP